MKLIGAAYCKNNWGKLLYFFECPECKNITKRTKTDGTRAKMCSDCRYKNMSGADSSSYKHGGKKCFPKIYKKWLGIKERCLNQRSKSYYRYGGRGINICDEWNIFETFKNWALNNGYKDGLTIDRVNNDGPYSPDNCRWVSLSENSKKKRTSKITDKDACDIRNMVSVGADRKAIAKEYSITYCTVCDIISGRTHKTT